MERLKEMAVEAYVAALRGEVEEVLRQVAQVVNAAADGRVIRDSEEPVRDLLGRLRARAYEKALQMRIDASEASFSPSGRSRTAAAEQGPAGVRLDHGQRGNPPAASALP